MLRRLDYRLWFLVTLVIIIEEKFHDGLEALLVALLERSNLLQRFWRTDGLWSGLNAFWL